MENLKVSVIITTYKRANMLSRAINSVLNQTYKNIEVIVVDDNNSDSDHRRNTESIMKQYYNDERVVYVKHKTNKNGAAARNTGTKIASGQVITFLDDDDYYLNMKVEKQLAYLLNNRQYSMVYCGYNRENRDIISNLEGDLSLEILSGRNLIYTNCIMIWKECSDSFGGWNESFKRNQEAVFLLRAFNRGYKIGVVPEVLVRFDVSDRSNALDGIDNENQYVQFLEEHNKIIDKLDYEKKGCKKLIYTYRYRGIFLNYLKIKDLKNALRIYLKMSRKMPIYFNIFLIKYVKNRLIKD